MEQITSLIKRLVKDSKSLPEPIELSFIRGDRFGWDHAARTITYDPMEGQVFTYLLHEYGHAILDHSDQSRDITLLEMERAAWDQATILAPRYGGAIAEDVIETALDTYRDWLHARSNCIACGATGVQISEDTYQCISCKTLWRVNDARSCALRRYQIK